MTSVGGSSLVQRRMAWAAFGGAARSGHAVLHPDLPEPALEAMAGSDGAQHKVSRITAGYDYVIPAARVDVETTAPDGRTERTITVSQEAMRRLMSVGWDCPAIGQAFVAIAILGLILHTATLWAFRRLTA